MVLNSQNNSIKETLKLIVFQLGELTLALPAANIERVIQIVEILVIPKLPKQICGMINMHGEIIPVLNMRALFGLPKKEQELSDKLLIVSTSKIKLALLIDDVQNLIDISSNKLVKSENLRYGNKQVQGLVKLETGMILFNDVEKFLDPKEIEDLVAVVNNIKLPLG